MFAYIDKTNKVIAVDGEAYIYGNTTVLKNAKGTVIAVGIANIEAALAKDDLVKDVVVDSNNVIKSFVGTSVASETLAAETAIDKIKAFTTPDATQAEVTAARSAYDALTPSQKDLVTNYATLTAEEAKLAAAKAITDANTFKTTNAAILAKTVDTVAITDDVDAVLSAYNRLSDEAKALLKNEKALLDSLKIKVDALKDAKAVADDKTALTIAGDLNDVQADLVLAATGTNGSKITWSSSNTAIVANDGKVTRPNGANVQVTLTATITKGATTDTKVFVVTVTGL